MKNFEHELFRLDGLIPYQAAAVLVESLTSYERAHKPPDSPLNDIDRCICDKGLYKPLQSITEGFTLTHKRNT